MADPINPYQPPQAQVEPAPAPEDPGQAARVAGFWGLMFALPCLGMFFALAALAGPGGMPASKAGMADWLLLALAMLAAGWLFGRSARRRTLPGLLAVSASVSLATISFMAAVALPRIMAGIHPKPGAGWGRIAFFVGLSFLLVGVILFLCFLALGSMIRWRAQAAARRAG